MAQSTAIRVPSLSTHTAKEKTIMTSSVGNRASNTATNNNALVLVLATAALCMCSLIHAFLLISVFPYAGYMVMDLKRPPLTAEQAGPWAGLLSASFMAGRAVSSYPWGRWADCYGRKFVLVTSLLLSAVLSILFGMAQTFYTAMIWRFLLGMSNGLVGTVKTVVSELAAANYKKNMDISNNEHTSTQTTKSNNNNNNNTLETRMMGLVVGMRAWGFLISPAIGGWLAEPTRQYPSLSLWSTAREKSGSGRTILWNILNQYPFLLPNLVGAFLCLWTALIAGCGIPETLPKEDLRGYHCIPGDLFLYIQHQFVVVLDKICCWRTTGVLRKSSESSTLLPHANATTSYHSQDTEESDNREKSQEKTSLSSTTTYETTTASKQPNTMTSLWSNQPTREHLVPYWFFSLVVVCLDEAFPLFCISTKGGLALQEADIGNILSLAGLVFAICQYAAYVSTVHHFGLYLSLSIGSFFGFFPVLFMPLSLLLSDEQRSVSSSSSSLTWESSLLLVSIMAVSKIFSCMFFTSMSIALNKTVEASQRASLNGLATIGGSIAKGIGPIVAGFLVTASFSSALVPAQYGSIIIFCCIGLMGIATVGQLHGLKPPS